MRTPLSRSFPFAVLALLAGCSSTPDGVSEDDGAAPPADDGAAGLDARAQVSDGATAADTRAPDAGTADANASDAGPLDASADARDANVNDASVPDTSVHDANVADVNAPDTNVAETSVHDASVADTNLPDTNLPDASLPDTSLPDTSLPDTSLPDTGVPIDATPPHDSSVPIDASLPPLDAGLDAGAPGDGHVVSLMPSNDWTRVDAKTSAQLDLATALAAQSPGRDQFASLSRDGAWVALVTTRFGCAGGDCLAVARSDGTSASLVSSGGATIAVSGRPAIASGGALIVYPATGGPHMSDLWAITKTAGAWSAPKLLTSTSPAQFQHDVAFAYDDATVVHVCGPSPYQVAGSSICVSKIDGTGTSVRVASNAGPGATSSSLTHHPDYSPDGSVVFEADWSGSEEIWRASGSSYAMVSPAGVSDDNSPCVLPDGRIASLWLGRAGNTQNYHELKVMNADGSGGAMLVTGVDLVDVGESCGW